MFTDVKFGDGEAESHINCSTVSDRIMEVWDRICCKHGFEYSSKGTDNKITDTNFYLLRIWWNLKVMDAMFLTSLVISSVYMSAPAHSAISIGRTGNLNPTKCPRNTQWKESCNVVGVSGFERWRQLRVGIQIRLINSQVPKIFVNAVISGFVDVCVRACMCGFVCVRVQIPDLSYVRIGHSLSPRWRTQSTVPKANYPRYFSLTLFSRRTMSCIVMQSDKNARGQVLSPPHFSQLHHHRHHHHNHHRHRHHHTSSSV